MAMAPMHWSPSESSLPSKTQQQDEEDERSYQRHRDLISTLPKDDRWAPVRQLQGFWLFDPCLLGTVASRDHFTARPTDIFLASVPKSGTTWLKSMVFSIVHRRRHLPRDEGHPLRHANPHELIPLLNLLYLWWKNPDLTALPSPRIFATHNPYSILPDPVKTSTCRIIFIAREPKDTFVSLWNFVTGVAPEGWPTPPLDVVLDLFCSGISMCGHIWEHALEYWNEHLARPDKVLFLKYEALKQDPVGNLNKIAAFLGCPFSTEETNQGVPEDISELCSFKHLNNLEVNKDGGLPRGPAFLQKKLFFRRGEVGDWVNHLTPEMAEKLDRVTQEKLQGSGLNF